MGARQPQTETSETTGPNKSFLISSYFSEMFIIAVKNLTNAGVLRKILQINSLESLEGGSKCPWATHGPHRQKCSAAFDDSDQGTSMC